MAAADAAAARRTRRRTEVERVWRVADCMGGSPSWDG
jgi:hypothetical protein